MNKPDFTLEMHVCRDSPAVCLISHPFSKWTAAASTLTLIITGPTWRNISTKQCFTSNDVSQKHKAINLLLPFLIITEAESCVALFVRCPDSIERTCTANHNSAWRGGRGGRIIAGQDGHKIKMAPPANISVPTKIHNWEEEERLV